MRRNQPCKFVFLPQPRSRPHLGCGVLNPDRGPAGTHIYHSEFLNRTAGPFGFSARRRSTALSGFAAANSKPGDGTARLKLMCRHLGWLTLTRRVVLFLLRCPPKSSPVGAFGTGSFWSPAASGRTARRGTLCKQQRTGDGTCEPGAWMLPRPLLVEVM